MSQLYFDAGPPASGRKVMLATPSYDSPDASYTFSISRSREALHKAGIQTAYLLLQGNCHVDDSRNVIVRDFLASDCSELIFLDADVSWEPEQLVKLTEFDCDIVGGVYPFRRESGEEGMPVRNKPGCFVPDENGLLEVDGLPTGFLRIKRHVLESMAKECPSFEKDGVTPLLFERDIFNGGRRGGDIRFCMKWGEMGGKLYAAAELRLGHCGKHIIRDSLGASLRRQGGLSLRHVAKLIRERKETPDTFFEALRAMQNPWGANTEVLALCAIMARKANGPIVETGSGLTTIILAAANPDQTVWCIEHSPVYASRLEQMAAEAGVSNIALCTAPIVGGWYDMAELEGMPERFSLGLNDGPPRLLGSRTEFFEKFGHRTETIIADDAESYKADIDAWCALNGRTVDYIEKRAALIRKREAA